MIHLLRDFYINADRFGYTVGILSANNERERENRAKSIILRQSRLLYYLVRCLGFYGRNRAP